MVPRGAPTHVVTHFSRLESIDPGPGVVNYSQSFGLPRQVIPRAGSAADLLRTHMVDSSGLSVPHVRHLARMRVGIMTRYAVPARWV